MFCARCGVANDLPEEIKYGGPVVKKQCEKCRHPTEISTGCRECDRIINDTAYSGAQGSLAKMMLARVLYVGQQVFSGHATDSIKDEFNNEIFSIIKEVLSRWDEDIPALLEDSDMQEFFLPFNGKDRNLMYLPMRANSKGVRPPALPLTAELMLTHPPLWRFYYEFFTWNEQFWLWEYYCDGIYSQFHEDVCLTCKLLALYDKCTMEMEPNEDYASQDKRFNAIDKIAGLTADDFVEKCWRPEPPFVPALVVIYEAPAPEEVSAPKEAVPVKKRKKSKIESPPVIVEPAEEEQPPAPKKHKHKTDVPAAPVLVSITATKKPKTKH